MSAKKEAPAPAAAADGTEPATPKSKMPMFAILAVGLAVGGGSGAAFIGPMVAKKLGKSAPANAEASKDGESAKGGKGEKSAEGEKGKTGEKGKEGEKGGETAMYLVENLVLNPAGSGGGRFLLFSVAIEAGDKAAEDEFKKRDAEMRDLILTELGSKSVDQLVDMSGRDGIKTQVQDVIIKRFGKTSIKRLYFPQFVVQ